MCKKQTSVSHSSTESEIISLDAGLRLDGIPALDLWDLVIEVLHSSLNQTRKSKETVRRNQLRNEPSRKHTNSQTKTQIACWLWMLDYVCMGYLLLTYGTWWSRCYVQLRIPFNLVTLAQGNLGKSNPTILAQGNLSMFSPTRQFVIPEPRPNVLTESKVLIYWTKWIAYPPTHILLKVNLSCTSLKTTKPWLRWGRSPTLRHVLRTHRVALDWFFW